MKKIAYYLYLLFIISFYLHLPSRIPALAPLRFDLLLVILVFIFILVSKEYKNLLELNPTTKILLILLIYIVVSIPFVKWPGSVIKNGSTEYIKAIIFYFYTIALVNTEKKFKIFLFVFIAVQTFRVLEPLYLHITEGYWGDKAFAEGEFMDRLAGSPHDVVNPNGLAYIIVSIIPLAHYWAFSTKIKGKILYYSLLPFLLYSLILTASRSGLIALLVILFGIFIRSRYKTIMIIISIVATITAFSRLSPDQKARYLSIFDETAKGSETVELRKTGIVNDFKVAMNRPIFGHGLGTSLEANFNFSGRFLRSHNLYTEIWQELGIIGLFIFVFFMFSIIKNYNFSLKTLSDVFLEGNNFWENITKGLQIWLFMNIIFSLASYGLSSPIWYLFAGISVVINKITENQYDHMISNNEEF